jgi:hypothetical protein
MSCIRFSFLVFPDGPDTLEFAISRYDSKFSRVCAKKFFRVHEADCAAVGFSPHPIGLNENNHDNQGQPNRLEVLANLLAQTG